MKMEFKDFYDLNQILILLVNHFFLLFFKFKRMNHELLADLH